MATKAKRVTKKQLAQRGKALQSLLEDARQLAAGTVAGLIGHPDYVTIDHARQEFVEFVATRGGALSWATWQEAWETFVRLNPQWVKPDQIETYTTAPASYDGHGTWEMNPFAGEDRGKTVRLVCTPVDFVGWQRERYASGLESAVGEIEWRKLVDAGIATQYTGEQSAAERKHHEYAYGGGYQADVAFDVGQVVRWASRTGDVDAEYRGKTMGLDGWEACVIVRPADGPPYQTMAPLSELSRLPEVAVEPAPEPVPEMQPEVVPEPEPILTNPPLLLPANLGALAKLAGESTKYALGGVRLTTTATGYTVAATDGKRLGLVEGEREPASVEGEFPEMPALLPCSSERSEAMIPAKAFAAACKAVPKRVYKPALKCLAVRLRENETVLASTDLDQQNVAVPRNLDGRFPDVQAVLPKNAPTAKILVNAKLLAELLTVAANYAMDDGARVELELHTDKGNLVLVRTAKAGQKFTGLLVGLS